MSASILLEEMTTEARRELADKLQIGFHRNVNVVLGGQFQGPPAFRFNLQGLGAVRLSGVLEHRAAAILQVPLILGGREAAPRKPSVRSSRPVEISMIVL